MTKKDKILEKDNRNPEMQEIKSALKDVTDKRMYQRIKVIFLHLKGYTNKHIAGLEELTEHTVGTYVKKYKQNGLAGLAMKHSPGAPRLLTSEQEMILLETITTKTPDQVGFPTRKNWYINIVQQFVKDNFGVNYSHRGMAEVMYRMNLSFTRPTYKLAKADPEKQQEFLTKFEVLKKS